MLNHFQYFILHAFLLCSSIFCVHFHCFGRLSGLLWDASGLLNVLGSFLNVLDCFWKLSERSGKLSERSGLLNVLDCFWAAQGSGLLNVLGFSTVRAHFYGIPALCACISIMFKHFLACISTVFQHWLRAFPLLREAFWIVLDCLWAAQRSGKLSGLL